MTEVDRAQHSSEEDTSLATMGNANARLVIILDQPGTYAGGTVSGKVMMQVIKDADCTHLKLTISGDENAHACWKTEIKLPDGTGTGMWETHHRHAHRNIFNVEIDLAHFPDRKATVGSYIYPFTAVLPADLPSTMHAAKGGGDCSISYKASARLHRAGVFQGGSAFSKKVDAQISIPVTTANGPQTLYHRSSRYG